MCGASLLLDRANEAPLSERRLLHYAAAAAASRWCVSRRLLPFLVVFGGTVLLLCLEEQQLLAECRSSRKRAQKAAEEKKSKDDDEGEEDEEEEDSGRGSEEEAREGERKGAETEKKEDEKKYSFCSNGLRDAVNAAILELAGQHYVANVLLTQYPSLPYVPILTCPTPEVPLGGGGRGEGPRAAEGEGRKGGGATGRGGGAESDEWKDLTTAAGRGSGETAEEAAEAAASAHFDSLWPELSDVQPADLLLEVLNTGKLRVAGLGAEQPSPSDPFSQRYYSGWASLRRRRIIGSSLPVPPSVATTKNAAAAAAGRAGRRGAGGGGGRGNVSGAEKRDVKKQPAVLSEKAEEPVLTSQTSRGFNWGDEGDYTVPQPTGYFPTYLRAIAERISEHYGRPIEVVWTFYTSGVDCFRSVRRGLTHMTDIYFLSAYQKNSSTTWEHFSHTCPVSGSPNLFVTLKEYNIHSLQDLVRHIRMTANPRLRTIAYLSTGNYETIQQFFPAHTLAEIMTKDEAEHRVASRQVLGNIRTGSTSGIPPDFVVVDLGLVLAQSPYFSRTDVPHCLYHQLLIREAVRSRQRRAAKDGTADAAGSKQSAAAPAAAFGHLSAAAAAAAAGSLLVGIATAAA